MDMRQYYKYCVLLIGLTVSAGCSFAQNSKAPSKGAALVFGGGHISALHDDLLKELEAATEKTGDPI